MMKIMENVIDILEALENDNSRNFKESLLHRKKNNELLKSIFVAVSDPYTNFYITKFKIPKTSIESSSDDEEILKNFLEFLNTKLATRNLTGNDAKRAVEKFFVALNDRQKKWCLRILLRNLRVGVSETTINKVWPGAVSKFSVQLAETLESHYENGKGIVIDDDIKYPVRVEPKLDGLRCIAVKHNGEVSLFTRSGSIIETLPTIKSILEAAPWDNWILDGEAMGQDWNESASVVMSYKTAKDDSNIVYNVFDAIEFDDWRDQKNDTEFQDRVECVRELLKSIKDSHVKQVEGKTVKNSKELLDFYSKSMEKGYEGIMIKSISSPYRFKRSDAVLKLKPVTTYEGVVVGHYEGKRGSKREGLWGGFEVLMPNGVITKCGGGYTDKMKAEIGINPDSWIGKIVEIEGQPDPLTKDGLTTDGKVRFPVFTRIRDSRDVDSKILDAFNAWKVKQKNL